ncbi:MAG: hypothetical protein EOP17_12815 [Rhizobiaceae bacterium]|nr:MAG: hypothetical protein EOP17_12815 [Rhizobiaceae bacterium]
MANDPIHQFQISKIVPIEIGGIDLSFTNASLFMTATVACAAGFLYFASSARSLIPGRAQSSLSVRLFANMLAGHITLKVFAGFVSSLGALGALGIGGAILPLAMTVALTGLEFLVAFLQAYVFAVLTCMYLNDAVHPGGH